MANGNVTITNGKGATKNIGGKAYELLNKGGILKIRNEEWWLEGTERPAGIQKSKPGNRIQEKKQAPKKPEGGFVPQELVSMKETRELKDKVTTLEAENEALKTENADLKAKLEAGNKPTPVVPDGAPDIKPGQSAKGELDPKPGKQANEANLGPDDKHEKQKP